jgi:hypothetical protein
VIVQVANILIEQSGENSMTVSYTDDDASMDQLKERWPDALAAAGWVEDSRGESGNGDMDLTYDLPDGRRALVTITVYRPKVWRVYIGLSEGGTP